MACWTEWLQIFLYDVLKVIHIKEEYVKSQPGADKISVVTKSATAFLNIESNMERFIERWQVFWRHR